MAVPYGYPTFPHHAPYHVAFEDLPTEPTIPGSGASARELIEHHPDKARQLLAEAGYPDGLNFEVFTVQADLDWVELYAGYWDDAGLNAQIKVMEPAVWASILATDHQGLASWTPGFWQQPFDMLLQCLYPEHACNHAHMVDQRYLDGADFVKQTLDQDAVIDYYRDLFVYTLEKSDYIAGVPFAKLQLWNPWVKGYSGEIANVGIQGLAHGGQERLARPGHEGRGDRHSRVADRPAPRQAEQGLAKFTFGERRQPLCFAAS